MRFSGDEEQPREKGGGRRTETALLTSTLVALLVETPEIKHTGGLGGCGSQRHTHARGGALAASRPRSTVPQGLTRVFCFFVFNFKAFHEKSDNKINEELRVRPLICVLSKETCRGKNAQSEMRHELLAADFHVPRFNTRGLTERGRDRLTHLCNAFLPISEQLRIFATSLF